MVEEDTKRSQYLKTKTPDVPLGKTTQQAHQTQRSAVTHMCHIRSTYHTRLAGANMAFRGTVFPLIFGGTLILFGFGFYHRYKLIINTEEQAQRKEYNIHKALEFRRTVKEKIDEKKSNS